MANITSLNSISFQTESQTSQKHSAFVLQLVNPEDTTLAYLREKRKPRITMNSFEDLIQTTPFRKFSGNITSLEITSRTNSNTLSTKKKLGTKSENLLWPRTSSEKLNQRKTGVRSMSTSASDLPKSKFLLESKRKQSENVQCREI